MAFIGYNIKAVVRIEPSIDKRKNPPKNNISIKFAPFKQKNPNGMGQLYDWKKALYFSMSAQNALVWVNTIKLALHDNIWGRCGIIHRYNNTSKTINISTTGDTYFITGKSDSASYTVSLKLEQLLALIDYLQAASLNQLKLDDELQLKYWKKSNSSESFNYDSNNSNFEQKTNSDEERPTSGYFDTPQKFDKVFKDEMNKRKKEDMFGF